MITINLWKNFAEKIMKTSESKIADLEKAVNALMRRVIFLEKENIRRKSDIEELKRNARK